MFLKFHFINTDGCTGTFAIAIFNKDNVLIDNSTINILRDDFSSDTACSQGTFTDTPPGAMCRRWASGDSILIIEIPDKTITRIGISTWANTVYPLEKVTVYRSDTYDGIYTELCTIECDARIIGTYTMSYETAEYSIEPEPIPEPEPSEPIEQKPPIYQSGLNTNIFKNPQDQHLFDLSYLGVLNHERKTIEINQQNHYFQIGDVLYYDIKNHKFAKALARNTIESEVCGVVSEIIDIDNFVMITSGEIKTTRYTFTPGTILYLSDAYEGKLVSIEPAYTVKQIATQLSDGIMIDIQRGYRTPNTESGSETLESYTQAELDEIIKNIW